MMKVKTLIVIIAIILFHGYAESESISSSKVNEDRTVKFSNTLFYEYYSTKLEHELRVKHNTAGAVGISLCKI